MICPGFIIARLTRWAKLQRERNSCHPETDWMEIDGHQSNGSYGVHQARVTLRSDPTVYRLIVAPADAPITINGRPIGEHFAKPLGDR